MAEVSPLANEIANETGIEVGAVRTVIAAMARRQFEHLSADLSRSTGVEIEAVKAVLAKVGGPHVTIDPGLLNDKLDNAGLTKKIQDALSHVYL